jgi:ketosteroid isomerase-like protein
LTAVMSNPRETVLAYWAAAQARDWDAFGDLLTEDIVYHLPQTGERIRGRPNYVQFNREYPGDWRVAVERAVGDGAHAATWTRFTVDGADQPGISFFDLDAQGRIVQVTDFWPEPYEPPPGREHLVERLS